MGRHFQKGVVRNPEHGGCMTCGRPLSENCASPLCLWCSRSQQKRWERVLAKRRKRAMKSPHLPCYVPPKGSVAMQFFGRVVNPLRGLGM